MAPVLGDHEFPTVWGAIAPTDTHELVGALGSTSSP